MKKKLTILFMLLSATLISQVQISGLITDTFDNPVPFAPIGLMSLPDSTIINGTLTDDFGKYSSKINQPGKYLLKIAVLGYKEKYSEEIRVDSSSNEISVPAIKLTSSSNTLEEVSISAIKRVIEFNNGNVTVNVENSPLAKGNTVYDLISKLPGVSIDNNAIQLNGKSGVIIMLDNRVQELTNAQLLNMLRSMNAEGVDKIELLKNPPVKYDASGTSGMINIKTKRTKIRGFGGSAYLSGSQGVLGRAGVGVTLNYKTDKFTVFTGLDYNYSMYESKNRFDKKIPTDTSAIELNSENTAIDKETGLTYKIGADWYINKRNTLGFKIDGGPASYISDTRGINTILGDNDLEFNYLKFSADIPDKWNVNNYNINAEHRFDTSGTVLTFNADYTGLSEHFLSDNRNLFLNKNKEEALPPNISRNDNKNRTDLFAAKLDFTKNFDPETTLEIGAKTRIFHSLNNYLYEKKNNLSGDYFKDPALSNDYSYNEQTYAVYINYIRTIKKLNFQLGVRAETTSIQARTEKMSIANKSYFNLFPNIAIEYKASDKHSFQLNLNRRIDRPTYDLLLPFQIYQDQYKYYQGNPFLLPHFSNTAELTHVFNRSITNSLSFTRINNIKLNYLRQIDSAKLTIETFKNMKYRNYFAYSFVIQRTLKPWWEMTVSGLAAYVENAGDVDGIPFRNTNFIYTPSMTNTFIAPKNTKIEVIAFYNSRKNTGFIQVESRWMFSFAIKKTFLNEKLDCSIGVNDLFYSFVTRSHVKFETQDWNYWMTTDTRRVVLSINYNFGKIKIHERDGEEPERLKN